MKNIFSLLALIIITNLPISCGLGCGPFDNRPYKIVSLSSQIGSVVDGIYNESISTEIDTAAIRMVVDESQQVGMHIGQFTNLAYACSPPEIAAQRLVLIEISSDAPVISNGVQFKIGESLEPLFRIIDYNSEISVSEFNTSSSIGNNFFGYEGQEIVFQLVSPPDQPISQIFTFTFTFDDGLEYQVQTPVFTVK